MNLKDLQRMAYLLARSDVDGDHPKGVSVTDPIFNDITNTLLMRLSHDYQPPENIVYEASTADKAAAYDRGYEQGYNATRKEDRDIIRSLEV